MFNNRIVKIISGGLALTVLSASTTWAFLGPAPTMVNDPQLIGLTKTLDRINQQMNKTMHLETIKKQVEDILQAKQQFDEQMEYQRTIDGQWRSAIDGIKAEWINRAMTVRDVSRLGWGRDGIDANRAFAALERFHADLTAIQNGAEQSKKENLKDILEEIYGDIPVSRDSGNAVSHAYKVMAETADFSGDYNTALNELEKENQSDAAKIANGGLSPEEVKRLGAQIDARSNEINILNGKMQRHSALLLSELVGDNARAEVKRYQAHVAEQTQYHKFVRAVRFTPGVPRGGGEPTQ
jgi:wobble nucleotide-excising tRNase